MGNAAPAKHFGRGFVDVLEMDAASNRGSTRSVTCREQTRYASSEGRFKVYIIDEAHMLTTEAFNAFLKTLEEPPPGVVFILATTDPSRLPRTIISRCPRFNFHLLGAEQVCRRLEKVAAEEGWKAETEALHVIAYLAEGSMRMRWASWSRPSLTKMRLLLPNMSAGLPGLPGKKTWRR